MNTTEKQNGPEICKKCGHPSFVVSELFDEHTNKTGFIKLIDDNFKDGICGCCHDKEIAKDEENE